MLVEKSSKVWAIGKTADEDHVERKTLRTYSSLEVHVFASLLDLEAGLQILFLPPEPFEIEPLPALGCPTIAI